MNPVLETRPVPIKGSENTMWLPRLSNNVKEVARKILPEDGDAANSDSAKSQYEDPMVFFKQIIVDLIPDICMSENQRIMERYNNKTNAFNKKLSLGDRLKTMNACKFKECRTYLKIEQHPNTVCP